MEESHSSVPPQSAIVHLLQDQGHCQEENEDEQ